MTDQLTIAFIGLGVMGGPMAGHLAATGHRVIAYNRTAARAEKWQHSQTEAGRSTDIAATPAQAASGVDIVISCVGNDQDVAQVLMGDDGALSTMAEGTLLIDHTTVSAKMARSIDAACAERGIAAIDAPVSGGQAGAENGALAVMCGGTKDAFTRAEPIMQAYGKRIVHVGDAGAGQTAKMANQMCIAGVLGGLSEAIRLTQASGIDADKVFEAISGGAAQSWQMENRWHTMVKDEFDFGFAVDWMRKDLAYALEEARRLGLESPITRQVDGFYEDIQNMDGGRQDTSSLIRRLPR
ncbi:NAD(P)-dependent oxidoreductase [Pontixanthobacter aestiaquae]|uniref:NAD-binding protein n=1 Tax=Pontixanthobacter aestiaquae TaxID=1509367 RepID=A0A844Z7R5_9SPHN|nr:NAD(P)-dependent oxidoreductase [Pontixanthobacter aestiaquae]MDN3646055.1 NAD(P)-dependent oxidoreductase [Pontixanthobacter aestiaquae]MXO82953.1 NAD-binding protein [Pontixanthobacter aestiaquae]